MMIEEIITLLRVNDWKDSGDYIAIAKGRDYMPKTWKQLIKKMREIWLSRKK